MRALKNLKLRHLAQMHFKVAIVAWMILLALYTPALSSAVLGGAVIALCGVTVVGAIVGCVGVVMTVQPGTTGRKGLGVEIAGLYSMAVGPFLYCLTQVIIASTTPNGWYDRGAFVAALYVIFAAVIARAAIVSSQWRSLRPSKG